MPGSGSQLWREAQALPEPAVAPDVAACRAQLDRIIASTDFDATDRNRRFLSFVVIEALEGRSDRIKAYTIATEVFGRGADFDPQGDPIVRVEAGQLRRALERYYLSAGRTDPVRISIPKGGYAPRFDLAEPPPPGTAPTSANAGPAAQEKRRKGIWLAALVGIVLVLLAAAGGAYFTGRTGLALRPDLPQLVVAPFEDLSQVGGTSALSVGLSEEVVSQLTKFRDLVVLSGDRDGAPLTPVPDRGERSPRYALSGTVDIDGQTFRLQARLTSREDGQVLWADSYTGDLSASRIIAIEQDIANQVATALAQPYGVIFQADAGRQNPRPPDDWEAYSCTLSYYSYRISLEPAQHPVVRRCLEEAVARFPSYATAWGLLAQIYVDEARFRFAPDPREGAASVERALETAGKAVALDPRNIRGLQAQMLALFFAGDMEAAIQVGRTALAINPNDSELKGEVGYRLALSGAWDEGCALVESARQSNPGPLGYYESALAICAYVRGDLPEASMWIRKVPLTSNPQYHLIAATIFGEMGDPAAKAEIDWIRQNAPHLYSNGRAEVALRVGRQEDIDRFMASLVKAGLPDGG